MITIRKIAELAGVSRGTVDRVVNGRGGVKKGVETRILRIIAEHGYKPNKAARVLASRHKSFLVGVVSTSLDNMFFTDVLRGIRTAEEEVGSLGVSIMYREVVKFSVEEQVAYIREMLAADIDALAINPITDAAVVEALHEVNRRGIPIIAFNSDVRDVERLAYIGCDYERSGRVAAGLVAMACGGRARVAVVVGALKSLGHSLRVKGFVDACANHPGLGLHSVVEMYDDEITSYSRVRDLTEREDAPDAFFFAAGGKEGGIRAIGESRLRGRVGIVTVDIDPLTIAHLRSGTVAATICQQPFVQGYEAVRQLANHLLYGDQPEEGVQYTQLEILIKESLEPLSADEETLMHSTR